MKYGCYAKLKPLEKFKKAPALDALSFELLMSYAHYFYPEIKMIKKIRRSLLWDRVLSLEVSKDFLLALDKIQEMEAIEPLRYYEKALKATLFLRLGKYDEAERHLKNIISELKNRTEPNLRYIRLYCEYIMAIIEGDLDRKREIKMESTSIDCSKAIKRWLRF